MIFWIFMIILCTLLDRNTHAINAGNEVGERQEFQRVLIGCQTEYMKESTDPYVRILCGPTLRRLERDNN